MIAQCQIESIEVDVIVKRRGRYTEETHAVPFGCVHGSTISFRVDRRSIMKRVRIQGPAIDWAGDLDDVVVDRGGTATIELFATGLQLMGQS